MRGGSPNDHLAWRTVGVGGRRAHYGVAGHGLPVLFIHGWVLGSHSYKRALKRLVRLDCQVYAPALPGFGGTAGLPRGQHHMAGYAAWADAFLDAVGVDEPALVIGHSFGGAIAAKLAHDFPDRVVSLVLVNSVGARVWSRDGARVRFMSQRPLWDWAINFPVDLVRENGAVPALAAVIEDALPNILTRPLEVWKAAMVARSADLMDDLADLKAGGVPVAVLWGEGDTIVPRACYDDFCSIPGVRGDLVPGRHSWLLADPDTFGEMMADAVAVATAARNARAGLSRVRADGTGGLASVVPLHPAEFERAANA